MARYLVCLDPVPAQDGTCASTAFVEQPTPWPTLTLEQGKDIGHAWLIAVMAVFAVKYFLKPSTHRRR